MVQCTKPLIAEGQIAWLTCVKEKMAFEMVDVFGYEQGVAPMYNFRGEIGPVAFSHAAFKAVTYDPRARRSPHHLSQCNTSTTWPSGVDRMLVNFDTGHPDWAARRSLMVDALPALALDGTGHGLPAVVPAGVRAQDGANKRKVNDVVGATIFKFLFDVDVTAELGQMFEWDGIIGPCIVTQQVPAASSIARMAEIRNNIYKKVSVSKAGQEYMALAMQRGMEGEIRLQDLMWIVLFAAYGGTSNLVHNILAHLLKDPVQQVVLFRYDSTAYILEGARLFPAVGGMNPWLTSQALPLKLPDGRTIEVPEGTYGGSLINGANLDPSVFQAPTSAFQPGRPEAERMLTFLNELGDIRKCPGASTAGCPAAPRPCPGTWLALRVAKATVAFFAEGAAAQGKSDL
ncbi:unnamed protein product [Polarella glacialis]|uniref:Uncharacterized protein n=1 Tax=Polarella glacialis TaxID=89957 RepID=A0A813FYT9_POLGL|nr:unnamed protein product [Polarella glacialis]